MQITLSVIVPVYNAANTIIQCIDSIIANLKNISFSWELLLINDGSTDFSLRIMQEYVSYSAYQEYIRIIDQPNLGVAVARNTGIQNSKGVFIAFNDADDEWLSGKIKLQMEYLFTHPEVGLVAGIYGNDEIDCIKKMGKENHITIRNQVFKNYFAPPTVIFRRTVLQKAKLFDSRMRYAEEGFFFNNIVYHYRCILLKQRVVKCINSKERWGESGLSGNLWEMEKGELYNLKCAYRFHYISLNIFIIAYCFSIAKFTRRLIIKGFRYLYVKSGIL